MMKDNFREVFPSLIVKQVKVLARMGHWFYQVFLVSLAIHEAQVDDAIPFYNIGLFSICGNSNSNQTLLHSEAQRYKNILDLVVENRKRLFNTSGYYIPNKLEYLTFDVCDNVTDLTAVLSDVLLNQQYAIDYPIRNFREPIIAFIFTYLPAVMTSLVLQVFSFTNTYVHYFEMIQLPDGTLQSSRFPRYTSDF